MDDGVGREFERARGAGVGDDGEEAPFGCGLCVVRCGAGGADLEREDAAGEGGAGAEHFDARAAQGVEEVFLRGGLAER